MLRIATRASTLARWQAERVGARLGEPVEYVLVTTTGDRDQRADLHAIGGTGDTASATSALATYTL